MPDSFEEQEAFWRVPLPKLQTLLEAGPEGLSDYEADKRLRSFGANVLRPARRAAIFRLFFSRFRNPLVIILLGRQRHFGTDWRNHQLPDHQGDRADERDAGFRAGIPRRSGGGAAQAVGGAPGDGAARRPARQDIPVAELVPGDVVLLSAGDLVPADGRLLEARDFFVNQALLTGEAYPVEKHASMSPTEWKTSQRVKCGVHGHLRDQRQRQMLVCRTGADTALGDIADSLACQAAAHRLRARHAALRHADHAPDGSAGALRAPGQRRVPPAVAGIFLFAIALAVGLTPELLPMVISVTLARGALRMAEKQVIVKRLAAIQDLGAMDVLCTDKTGTLTEARIRLERHVDAQGRDSERVLELAYLNSYFETGLKSPLDDAILAARGDRRQRLAQDRRGAVRLRAAARLGAGGQREAAASSWSRERPKIFCGCPRTTRRMADVHSRRSTMHARRAHPGRARQPWGERVSACWHRLAAVWRRITRTPSSTTRPSWSSPVSPLSSIRRRRAPAPALEALAQSGVAVKIVTGDNELVTRHVCSRTRVARHAAC